MQQHSHIPQQTDRLTASNFAEEKRSVQNLNKCGNKPHARTVTTGYTRGAVCARVQTATLLLQVSGQLLAAATQLQGTN
jgi:hypothetical protein